MKEYIDKICEGEKMNGTDVDTIFTIAMSAGVLAVASFIVMGGIALMKWAGVF